MRSKVIFGHPKWPPAAILRKKSKKLKFRIDLKWREMHSKVIFDHPKLPPAAILWKIIKVAYWSEIARNATESDFRSSKMAAGSHFVEKIKKIKVAYWSEMARNAFKSDFRSSEIAAGSHFVKTNQSSELIWNGEKCDQKWFSVIQNGRWQPFCEK